MRARGARDLGELIVSDRAYKWVSVAAVLLGLALAWAAPAANPPPAMTVAPGYNALFSWAPVTAYTNGKPLAATPNYKMFNVTNPALPGFVGYVGKGVLSVHKLLPNPGVVCYAFAAEVYDPNTNQSALSTPVCVSVVPNSPPPAPPKPVATSPVCVQ